MRGLTLLSIALLLAGAALLYQGITREGGQIYIFLIFPVLSVSGPLSALGALLLFLGIFVGFLSLATGLPRVSSFLQTGPPAATVLDAKPGRKRWGGILLLGPIPVVFGSDVKLTTAMLILALALTVTLIILFL